MSAQAVIEGLEKTGTGEGKLRVARQFLERKPGASGTELVAHLKEQGISPVTLAKAEHLASGKNLDDLLGTPPKQSKEASEERLGKIIGEKLGEAMERLHGTASVKMDEAQALSIGRPQRPGK